MKKGIFLMGILLLVSCGNDDGSDVLPMPQTTCVNLEIALYEASDSIESSEPFTSTDSERFNFSQSTTIYDGLGMTHELSLYYVKEPLDPEDLITGGIPNTWSMYVEVDGQNVGGIDPEEPRPARYILRFSDDGTLMQTEPSRIVVANWNPSAGTDFDENTHITLLPDPFTATVFEPPVSSNFEIIVEAALVDELASISLEASVCSQ